MFDDFSPGFNGKRTDRMNKHGHIPLETGNFTATSKLYKGDISKSLATFVCQVELLQSCVETYPNFTPTYPIVRVCTGSEVNESLVLTLGKSENKKSQPVML